MASSPRNFVLLLLAAFLGTVLAPRVGVAAPAWRNDPGSGSVLVCVLESVALDTLGGRSVEVALPRRGMGTKGLDPIGTRIGNLPPGDYEIEAGVLLFGAQRVRVHVRADAEDTVTVILSPPRSVPAGHRYVATPPAALPPRPGDEARYPPAGFSFVLSTGRGERIDSAAGLVTKDRVAAPDTTTRLRFTAAELDRIRERMIAIRFFDLAEPHPADWPGGVATPSTTLHLEATAGGVTRRLDYLEGFTEDSYPSDDWKRVRDLVGLIREIVRARSEWRALPPARGGYL